MSSILAACHVSLSPPFMWVILCFFFFFFGGPFPSFVVVFTIPFISLKLVLHGCVSFIDR